MNCKIDLQNKTVTLVLPLQALPLSKSGKSRIVASTNGGVKTDAIVDGKPVTINVNAYIPAA